MTNAHVKFYLTIIWGGSVRITFEKSIFFKLTQNLIYRDWYHLIPKYIKKYQKIFQKRQLNVEKNHTCYKSGRWEHTKHTI